MSRVQYLDGLRAVAIIAVLGVHWIASQFPVAYGGYIGVDVFFILSGYIITTLLWRNQHSQSIRANYGHFLRRRVSRLYPALLAFVVVTLIIYAVFPGAPTRLEELVIPAILALTQGYSFYAASGAATSAPFAITWSLSVEWMFYLVWPLVVFAAKEAAVPARRLAFWASVSAVGLYVLALFQDSHWFYYGPVARIPEILVGCVLALVLQSSDVKERKSSKPRLRSTGAAVALLFLAAYSVFGPVQWSPVFRFVGLPLTVLAVAYLIWFGRSMPDARLTSVLSWAPLTFVGRISYSLYLWHMVGLNLFTTENVGELPLLGVAALGVGVALGMALISYRLLELPRSRQSSKSRTLKPADSAADALGVGR
ncbi:acyltransferase family protein [Frigoribacterium faeni]|uniref:acyltransferase family protein n=1 Tax=Frigoribacterium faeni TaxID=145483 RepID=UPI002413BBBA|nr:acyltransferase [Frigoribacterium faeni]